MDLYLIHWPITLPHSTELGGEGYGKENRKVHASGWDFRNTWTEMERLLSTGKVKAIGVGNLSTVNLEKLLKTAKVIPGVNQTEIQPLLSQRKLNEYCKERGIHQTAFGPLGGSGSSLHENTTILEIAKRRGVTTGNAMLSWGVQEGWSVIPKSTNRKRIGENLKNNLFLDEEELKAMNRLTIPKGKRFNRPDWGTVVFHDDDDDGDDESIE